MLARKPPFEGEPNARDMILNGIPPAVDPSWNAAFVEVSVLYNHDYNHPAYYLKKGPHGAFHTRDFVV